MTTKNVKPVKPVKATKEEIVKAVRETLALLDENTFNDFCEDGQTKILQLAKIAEVDVSNFISKELAFYNVEIYNIETDFPFADEDDWEVEAKLIHRPSGKKYDLDISVNINSVNY